FDHDVANHLGEAQKRRGIDQHFRATVKGIEQHDTHKTVVVDGPGGEHRLDVDLVLLATGRAPLTKGLGLDDIGVVIDHKGAIVVDEHFQTSVPGVYAIGDVIDRHNLTPVALAQAMLVAKTLFATPPTPLDWENIPTAVFSNPPVGTVGMGEAEARRRFADVVVYRSIFTPLKSTVSGRQEKTLMKLIVDAASDRVVGLHMVGPDAGEIVQGFAVAIKCGATKAQLDSTIGIHPTAAEEFVTMRSPMTGPPPSQLVGPPTSTQAASLKIST
ncbi:MAG TPA: FAD-dependent oxidoreductase, partial [Myxococcota bacterium]